MHRFSEYLAYPLGRDSARMTSNKDRPMGLLDLSGQRIVSLSRGLKESEGQCASIICLDLSNNFISDGQLKHLGEAPIRWLSLSGNALLSLSQLPLLPHVRIFSAERNQLTEISFQNILSSLPSVRVLSLGSNRIRSLEFPTYVQQVAADKYDSSRVARNFSIQAISFRNNELTSLSGFSSRLFPFLSTIDIDSNRIEGLDSLDSDLPSLVHLSARSNRIKTLRNDRNSSKSLLNESVSNPSSYLSFPLLETLMLDKNMISDISPLKGCRRLRSLSVSHNCLTSFPSLSSFSEWCHTLVYLDLSFNRLPDTALVQIAALRNLKQLNLRGNRFTSLSNFIATINSGTLPHLIELDVRNIDWKFSSGIEAQGEAHSSNSSTSLPLSLSQLQTPLSLPALSGPGSVLHSSALGARLHDSRRILPSSVHSSVQSSSESNASMRVLFAPVNAEDYCLTMQQQGNATQANTTVPSLFRFAPHVSDNVAIEDDADAWTGIAATEEQLRARYDRLRASNRTMQALSGSDLEFLRVVSTAQSSNLLLLNNLAVDLASQTSRALHPAPSRVTSIFSSPDAQSIRQISSSPTSIPVASARSPPVPLHARFTPTNDLAQRLPSPSGSRRRRASPEPLREPYVPHNHVLVERAPPRSPPGPTRPFTSPNRYRATPQRTGRTSTPVRSSAESLKEQHLTQSPRSPIHPTVRATTKGFNVMSTSNVPIASGILPSIHVSPHTANLRKEKIDKILQQSTLRESPSRSPRDITVDDLQYLDPEMQNTWELMPMAATPPPATSSSSSRSDLKPSKDHNNNNVPVGYNSPDLSHVSGTRPFGSLSSIAPSSSLPTGTHTFHSPMGMDRTNSPKDLDAVFSNTLSPLPINSPSVVPVRGQSLTIGKPEEAPSYMSLFASRNDQPDTRKNTYRPLTRSEASEISFLPFATAASSSHTLPQVNASLVNMRTKLPASQLRPLTPTRESRSFSVSDQEGPQISSHYKAQPPASQLPVHTSRRGAKPPSIDAAATMYMKPVKWEHSLRPWLGSQPGTLAPSARKSVVQHRAQSLPASPPSLPRPTQIDQEQYESRWRLQQSRLGMASTVSPPKLPDSSKSINQIEHSMTDLLAARPAVARSPSPLLVRRESDASKQGSASLSTRELIRRDKRKALLAKLKPERVRPESLPSAGKPSVSSPIALLSTLEASQSRFASTAVDNSRSTCGVASHPDTFTSSRENQQGTHHNRRHRHRLHKRKWKQLAHQLNELKATFRHQPGGDLGLSQLRQTLLELAPESTTSGTESTPSSASYSSASSDSTAFNKSRGRRRSSSRRRYRSKKRSSKKVRADSLERSQSSQDPRQPPDTLATAQFISQHSTNAFQELYNKMMNLASSLQEEYSRGSSTSVPREDEQASMKESKVDTAIRIFKEAPPSSTKQAPESHPAKSVLLEFSPPVHRSNGSTDSCLATSGADVQDRTLRMADLHRSDDVQVEAIAPRRESLDDQEDFHARSRSFGTSSAASTTSTTHLLSGTITPPSPATSSNESAPAAVTPSAAFHSPAPTDAKTTDYFLSTEKNDVLQVSPTRPSPLLSHTSQTNRLQSPLSSLTNAFRSSAQRFRSLSSPSALQLSRSYALRDSNGEQRSLYDSLNRSERGSGIRGQNSTSPAQRRRSNSPRAARMTTPLSPPLSTFVPRALSSSASKTSRTTSMNSRGSLSSPSFPRSPSIPRTVPAFKITQEKDVRSPEVSLETLSQSIQEKIQNLVLDESGESSVSHGTNLSFSSGTLGSEVGQSLSLSEMEQEWDSEVEAVRALEKYPTPVFPAGQRSSGPYASSVPNETSPESPDVPNAPMSWKERKNLSILEEIQQRNEEFQSFPFPKTELDPALLQPVPQLSISQVYSNTRSRNGSFREELEGTPQSHVMTSSTSSFKSPSSVQTPQHASEDSSPNASSQNAGTSHPLEDAIFHTDRAVRNIWESALDMVAPVYTNAFDEMKTTDVVEYAPETLQGAEQLVEEAKTAAILAANATVLVAVQGAPNTSLVTNSTNAESNSQQPLTRNNLYSFDELIASIPERSKSQSLTAVQALYQKYGLPVPNAQVSSIPTATSHVQVPPQSSMSPLTSTQTTGVNAYTSPARSSSASRGRSLSFSMRSPSPHSNSISSGTPLFSSPIPKLDPMEVQRVYRELQRSGSPHTKALVPASPISSAGSAVTALSPSGPSPLSPTSQVSLPPTSPPHSSPPPVPRASPLPPSHPTRSRSRSHSMQGENGQVVQTSPQFALPTSSTGSPEMNHRIYMQQLEELKQQLQQLQSQQAKQNQEIEKATGIGNHTSGQAIKSPQASGALSPNKHSSLLPKVSKEVQSSDKESGLKAPVPDLSRSRSVSNASMALLHSQLFSSALQAAASVLNTSSVSSRSLHASPSFGGLDAPLSPSLTLSPDTGEDSAALDRTTPSSPSFGVSRAVDRSAAVSPSHDATSRRSPSPSGTQKGSYTTPSSLRKRANPEYDAYGFGRSPRVLFGTPSHEPSSDTAEPVLSLALPFNRSRSLTSPHSSQPMHGNTHTQLRSQSSTSSSRSRSASRSPAAGAALTGVDPWNNPYFRKLQEQEHDFRSSIRAPSLAKVTTRYANSQDGLFSIPSYGSENVPPPVSDFQPFLASGKKHKLKQSLDESNTSSISRRSRSHSRSQSIGQRGEKMSSVEAHHNRSVSLEMIGEAVTHSCFSCAVNAATYLHEGVPSGEPYAATTPHHPNISNTKQGNSIAATSSVQQTAVQTAADPMAMTTTFFQSSSTSSTPGTPFRTTQRASRHVVKAAELITGSTDQAEAAESNESQQLSNRSGQEQSMPLEMASIPHFSFGTSSNMLESVASSTHALRHMPHSPPPPPIPPLPPIAQYSSPLRVSDLDITQKANARLNHVMEPDQVMSEAQVRSGSRSTPNAGAHLGGPRGRSSSGARRRSSKSVDRSRNGSVPADVTQVAGNMSPAQLYKLRNLDSTAMAGVLQGE